MSSIPPISASLSRRSFLAGALAFGGAATAGSTLLAACGSSKSSSSNKGGSSAGGSGGTSLAVQLVWLKNVQFGGSWIAQKQGLYDKFGVKPTLLAGGPNTVVEPIVVSGKALVGVSNPDSVASAVAKGADLEIVAATYLKSPFMVMSLLDNQIVSPQQMLGKKIGVPAASTQLWHSFLKANKIDPTKLTTVPVQFDVTPLANKQVDGYLGFITDEPIILQERGVKTHVMKFDDFNYHLFGDCYVIRRGALDDSGDRKTILGFLRAERMGWQKAVADPDLAAQLAVDLSGKDLKLGLRQQKLEAKAQAPLVQPPGTSAKGVLIMTDELVQQNLDTLNLNPSVPAKKELFNTALVKELSAT